MEPNSLSYVPPSSPLSQSPRAFSNWTIPACCVGHEIVGKAVRVGSKVKGIEVGDRVGVGAQARSCLESDCPQCSNQQENYCKRGNVGHSATSDNTLLPHRLFRLVANDSLRSAHTALFTPTTRGNHTAAMLTITVPMVTSCLRFQMAYHLLLPRLCYVAASPYSHLYSTTAVDQVNQSVLWVLAD